mgnify:CR=1 FL=1
MSSHERGECACCARKLDALRIAGAIDGLHMRQRDAYRDVLSDLIAELRDRAVTEDHWVESLGKKRVPRLAGWIGPTLDRAEARLREVEARLKGLDDV